MKLLLDTHAFLWFVLADAKLSPTALALIQDPQNDLLISPASVWEIAIKVSLGKYSMPVPFADFFENQLSLNSIELLPITIRHAQTVSQQPFHHWDPFDRLLVGQALADQLPIVSADAALDAYGIQRKW